MMVDDSATILRSAEFFLPDVQLEKFTNAYDALGAVARLRPSVCFLDVQMPGVSGYDLCFIIKDSEDLAATPVYMVSGETTAVDIQRAAVHLCDGYITKPFREVQLRETVARHVPGFPLVRPPKEG